MSKSRPRILDSITGQCCALLLSALLKNNVYSKQNEILSDILCWMILPILFANHDRYRPDSVSKELLPKPHTSRHQHASLVSLWVVAAAIAVACCYMSEIGIVGLLPALTPITLMLEDRSVSKHDGQNFPEPWYRFTVFANTVWGTTLVAVFAIYNLSSWDLPVFAISTFLVASLFVVYGSFMSRTDGKPNSLRQIHIEDSILPLSARVISILSVVLCTQIYFFGHPTNDIVLTAIGSFAKALCWYFIFLITRHTSWCIANTIGIFAFAANTKFMMLPSDASACSSVVVSLLSLSQTINILPKQAKGRSALWIFSLFALIPYFANIFAIERTQYSTPEGLEDHPVAALAHKARSEFQIRLRRQSQTYTAACAEYRRRYNNEPPPGFEAWYDFAIANKSPIIDEFDMIFDMVSPFWKLSGKEISRIVDRVQSMMDVDLWHCTLPRLGSHGQCRHPNRSFDRHIGQLFDTLLGNVSGSLPRIEFLVNHLDEPRVLLPSTLSSGDSSIKKEVFSTSNLSRKPTFSAITKCCTSSQRNRTTETIDTYGLPLVTDRLLEVDLCSHPEYSSMHGMLMSPTSFKLLEGMVPLLSTGSLSTMGDLLYPSPAYLESEFQYDQDRDVAWSKKENKLYWAGSTTGGYTSDNSWSRFHRQRFVKLVQDLEPRRRATYLTERDGAINTRKSSFLNGRLFDVSFTRIFQCEWRFCWKQWTYFHSKPWADKDRAFRSRLVFDIDGNGISGRFYKLLASRSLPLKQTLLREWHDERLVPWLHYVPVSQSMAELPELVLYLTSTPEGQKIAEEIADRGRKWFAEAFRDVDLSIYTYRLTLELARIQDPERKAS